MNPRKVLGLPAGPLDRSELKRAYARELRLHRPADDPEGFQRVRAAYEMLSAWLDRDATAAAEARRDPWEEASEEEEADEEPPEEGAEGAADEGPSTAPAPSSPPADGPEPRSRRGVPWAAPPTRAEPPTSVPWTADLLLAAWLRGETSLALDGIRALAREGNVEEIEALARRLLEEPCFRERADLPGFAIAVAQVTALLRRDLAQALADLAWQRTTPSERRRLDLHAVDLRRLAARHIAPWPVAAKRALLRVTAGVACPPPPRPHDWEEALGRIRRLPSDSPTLAWLEAEAPEVLKASGARRTPRRPGRQRARNPRSWWIVFLIAPIVSLLSTSLRHAPTERSGARDSLYDPVDVKALLDQVEAHRRGGPDASEEAQILLTLESLRTVPPPSVEKIRSTLALLEKRPSFEPAYQRSALIRRLYDSLREGLRAETGEAEPETPRDR